MLNKEFILSIISPLLNKNRELSEAEFFELFGELEQKEQYEVINIMIDNNIEYVEEKEEEIKELKKSNSLLKPMIEHKNLKHISNEILCHMAQNGDEFAVAAIIDNNKRFIYRVALQVNYAFKQNSLSIDDLFQEGCLGALEAIKKFDTSKDIKFVTYSWHWIRQKMYRAIMDTGYLIRIPVHKFDKMIKVLKCQSQHQEASPKEVAEILGDFNESEVIELLILSDNYLNTISLNTLVGEDHSTELSDLLPHELGISTDEEAIYKLLKIELNSVLSTLSDREKRVLELRFGITDGRERTLEEIGAIHNVTRERIRQIEAKALRKLRHPSRSKKLKDYID